MNLNARYRNSCESKESSIASEHGEEGLARHKAISLAKGASSFIILAMPKRQRETEKHRQAKQVSNPTASEGVKEPITRAYVHSVRGKLKENGLLKALMAEKKKEREL
jgi:hypothetical protein